MSPLLWLLGSLPVQAKSWCAKELAVHEWGAVVWADAPGELPEQFHTTGPSSSAFPGSVLRLPVDSGERAKPVLAFHVASPEYAGTIPFAMSVGLAQPVAWYPQVTARQMPEGTLAPAEVRVSRQALQTVLWGQELPPSWHDPAHTLFWDPLTLTAAPEHPLSETDEAWITAQRQVPSLYVNGADESERFLFYEGLEAAAPPVQLRDQGLANLSDQPLHDVLLIRPDGTWASLDLLAPNTTASPVEGQGPLSGFFSRWVLPELDLDPGGIGDSERCVMMRDPALPVTQAVDHRLTQAEVDVLLGAWEELLNPSDAPVIVYREDPATLHQAAPLALYTDMRWYPTLRRLSIGIVADGAQGVRR